MILTGQEIRELAEYAGFNITVEDEDYLDQEFSIDKCPKLGVCGDDGVARYYGYVVTCDGCDANECTPLGNQLPKPPKD